MKRRIAKSEVSGQRSEAGKWSLVNREEQAFLVAIARCMSQEFRVQGCPARVALEFSLMPGLNQKIMRLRRQFVQGSEVGYGGANIKEIWLKVGVDCVKPLIGREKRVYLCGNRFYSFVPLQIGHGAERKNYHRADNTYCYKEED